MSKFGFFNAYKVYDSCHNEPCTQMKRFHLSIQNALMIRENNSRLLHLQDGKDPYSECTRAQLIPSCADFEFD